jgi:hypothetical protein
MLVMLDEPKNESGGSEAAAPIFSAIGGGVLRYLDVPPSDATPVAIVSGPSDTAAAARAKAPIVDDAAGDSRVMPELRGRTLRNALAALAAARRGREGGRPRAGGGAGARALARRCRPTPACG